TSGLDPVIRSELLDILTELIQDENKGIFFSTHITSDLDKIADYITFINDGEIVLSDTKDSLLENYGLLKGPKSLMDSIDKKDIVGVKENQYGLETLVRNKNKVMRLFNGKAVMEKPTLDDIMVYYTRRNEHA
ncbi:MAG TPA: sodium ABC transporter ATP-binding protein, partial [Clostridiales bacterium]|nr:sodium ABC transporter ATP-binding protein [Clostridiales bacterium]